MKTSLVLAARVAGLLGLSLMLTSCGSDEPSIPGLSGAGSSESASSSMQDDEWAGQEDTESPTETPAEEEPVEADSERELPACTEAISLDEANEIMRATNVVFDSETEGTAFLERDSRLGPAARAAFTSADRVASCVWYIPNSDGFLYFHWAQLSAEERDEFLAELRASDYVEDEVNGEPMFSYDDGEWGLGVGLMQFGFVDNLLIYTQSTEPQHLTSVMAELQELG